MPISENRIMMQLLSSIKKAALIKPEDGAIHYNLGAAYSNNEQYEQAIEQYIKAVEIDPAMADAHNGLAFGFYKLKEYDSAWRHIIIADELGTEIDENLLAAIEDKL
ncbi:unnamed protein product [marine sediment metagenome]|uniref:Uncharacterized protein n=1 Tax=marine sediment metagenome TaxID=412755 RepID=X1CDH4_9ZZZZ